MLTRLLLLATAILGSAVIFTGAWPVPAASFHEAAEVRFVAQPIALDPDVVGAGVDARELIDKSLAKLDAPWLTTKIRQTTANGDSRCISEGYLHRAPNHCARLEMKIGAAKAPLLAVCDGYVVAQVSDDGKPLVAPLSDPKGAELEKLGCGGPAVFLRAVKRHLDDARLQTGKLGEQAVIQIETSLTPDPKRGNGRVAATACQIFLDAATLWPSRVEWTGNGHPILRVEFLEPTVGREMSVEECSRLFSYRP
jgi:hypothetical protein